MTQEKTTENPENFDDDCTQVAESFKPIKQEKTTEEETYMEEIRCPNCGNTKFHNIPKGVSKYRYRLLNRCDRCGCSLNAFGYEL